jgi:CRISPR system Cascade subunit CasC
MSRTIIDIHILQTVPPSNINRDDTGSPKSAVYGGVRRARVSSQAWKRATRKEFSKTVDAFELGERTKKLVELIAGEIEAIAPDLKGSAVAIAEKTLMTAGIKVEKPKRGDSEGIAEVAYLLFLSRHQIRNLAQLAVDAESSGAVLEKATVKRVADSDHSIDIALFGRMVADAADLNVDAAAQVAHAISVHAVDNEYDYFTAVDDQASEDNAGAGMIGTVEFNSSTLYRYATVDVDALQRNLGNADAAARAVGAFTRSFVTSMPTGKQNTFANRTLPEGVVVIVRDVQSVNLVGAFEDAVVASNGATRVAVASERLADYSADIDRAYSQTPVASFVVHVGPQTVALERLGDSVDLEGLIQAVQSLSEERLRMQS